MSARQVEATRTGVGRGRAWLLDFYSKIFFYNMRMSRKLLPNGRAMLGLCAACFLMVWDPSKIAIRYFFTLSVASFAIASVLNFARQPRHLKFERVLPERALEGALFDYHITITNCGKRSSPPMSCRDHGVLRFPKHKDWVKNTPPFDGQLNAFDRFFGYPKWIWLIENLQDVIGYDFDIPALQPGQSTTIAAQGKAGKRGKRMFLGFYCGLVDPFGLLRRLFYVKSRQGLLVLPRPIRCSVGIPAGSRSLSAGDSRDIRKTGDSEEFRSLREWRSGDPMRRIDWKATARSGIPIAREFAPEHKLRTALAFDTYLPEDRDEEAFEVAMGCAAGFVVSLDRKERNIDLLVLEQHVVPLRLGAGSGDHILALERLASCSPSKSTSLELLEESILKSSSNFTSAILVCSSWTPRHGEMAKKLLARGIGLAIVSCSAPSAEPPPGAQFLVMDKELA